MKSVFITGSTSMIGLAFLKECIKNKTKAYILLRNNSKNNNRLPKESEYVEYVYGDIENTAAISFNKNNIDIFYHFAWMGTDKIQRNSTDIQVKNISITLEMIRFAKQIGCKKFIGAGSQAEYGFSDNSITENTFANPQSSYGISKFAAGKLSEILCKELDIAFVWGRIFSVYGENDNSFAMIPQCLENIKQKKKICLSSCEQMWNYLHSDDCGSIFYLLGANLKAQGYFNIAHPESRRLKEYIDIIVAMTDGLEFVTFSSHEGSGIQPCIEKLQNCINWTPYVSFEEGIRKILSN